MVTSDQLLQLITHLQSSGDKLYIRDTLLKYIRKRSKAQLAVLFVLDRDQQTLFPLAYTGKLPDRQSALTSEGSLPSAKQHTRQPIPINGLFASVLPNQRLLYIPYVEHDLRILPQELNWIYPEGSVLLNAVTTGDNSQNEQGVMALCFSAENKNAQSPEKYSFDRERGRSTDLQPSALVFAFKSDASGYPFPKTSFASNTQA